MKIIFYGNRQGNFFDKLIRWWTSPLKKMFNGEWKDSYSHCEILFSDGVIFSASQYENRTRFKKLNIGLHWTKIEMEISYFAESIVRDWCVSVSGDKYDYAGILGFVVGVHHDRKKWFCSEVCTRALQEVGICSGLKAYKISPNRLYEEIQTKQKNRS